MSTRKIAVTIESTVEYTGTYEIDDAEYQEWLLGEDGYGPYEDTDRMLAGFLQAGRDRDEIIEQVLDGATMHEIEWVHSRIDSVETIGEQKTV